MRSQANNANKIKKMLNELGNGKGYFMRGKISKIVEILHSIPFTNFESV